MLRHDTTLILGAGASKIFGLPLGEDLRNILSRDLSIQFDDWGGKLEQGSPDIVYALREIATNDQSLRGDIGPLVKIANEIADAMPMCSSIDDYIERHSDQGRHELCAKLGIAHAILQAERHSPLWDNPRSDTPLKLSKFGGCWLSLFLQLVTRQATRSSLKDAFSRLRVISFNYDRCFEHFTFHWLQQVYKIDYAEAQNICADLNIIHPYGSLGDIFDIRQNNRTSFGAQPSSSRLIDVAPGIFTYSESKQDKNKAALAKYFLDDCQRIVILGFAFHSQNINYLTTAPRSKGVHRRVFSSTVGISAVKWETMRQRLSICLNTSGESLLTHTDSTSCESLIMEYADQIAE